jgi:hypothetical protein
MPGATRREFLAGSSAMLAFLVDGVTLMLTPAEARAQGVPLQHLSPAQGLMLERLGEALVPGARTAGIAHFVDQQLGQPDSMLLMIKYLGVAPADRTGFYRSALDAALAATADARAPMADGELLRRMAADDLSAWDGPPASFVYFVLRADALDVVYGTRDGFARLGIPYMAHVEPPADW